MRAHARAHAGVGNMRATMVVKGVFALSAMMDEQERRKERYRKKMTTRRSTDDDSEIIK